LRCGTNQENMGNKNLIRGTNHNYKRRNKKPTTIEQISNLRKQKFRPRKKSRLGGTKKYSTEQIVTTKKERKN
jgi:hypothetical protein